MASASPRLPAISMILAHRKLFCILLSLFQLLICSLSLAAPVPPSFRFMDHQPRRRQLFWLAVPSPSSSLRPMDPLSALSNRPFAELIPLCCPLRSKSRTLRSRILRYPLSAQKHRPFAELVPSCCASPSKSRTLRNRRSRRQRPRHLSQSRSKRLLRSRPQSLFRS